MKTPAEKLAEKLLGRHPDAVFVCMSPAGCGLYSIRENPTLVCPKCGKPPPADRIEGVERCIIEARTAEQTLQAKEPEPPPPEPKGAPPGLADVIGNAPAVAQIAVALRAHRNRLAAFEGSAETTRRPVFPHLLLSGPGGIGKTMLAEIVARELKCRLRLQMGQSMGNPARVADMLLSLKAGDVLFIDEMHGLKPAAQETLYRAMEDGILIPILKAGMPPSKPIRLQPFTIVGSTTDEWGLLPSLLQRFKYQIRLERLTAEELAESLLLRAKRRGWPLADKAARMIAERAHGTPRLAIGLLDGCMDVARAGGIRDIDCGVVERTCDLWRLDELGLDSVARKYLHFLEIGGGPVRLNVLASKLDGLSRLTIERRIEPDLVWLGLIEKGADGRRLTEAGRKHLKDARLALTEPRLLVASVLTAR